MKCLESLYTNTRNEEMKGNAKCKNYRFKPPFGGLMGNAQGSSMACYPLGDLWVTHRVHLWLVGKVGKRIVDFLLAIIESFR